jgi:hypothetical protein
MGLRESIDEGAGDIGAEIGEEIPSTATELRDEVPADIEALRAGDAGPGPTNGQRPSDDLSIDTVLGDTPLDRFL